MGQVEISTAVVTGAGSGIGRAVALALAKSGSRVALVGRTQEKLLAVAASAAGYAGKVSPHRADLDKDEEILALVRALKSQGSDLDLLVHCAAEIFIGPVAKAPVAELDRQYRVNLRAPYLLTQALLPSLRRSQGQVVFINSTAGLTARGGISQYAAVKFALKALADALRDEVLDDGIRVLSVYPGRTATAMQQRVHELEERTYRPELLIQPEDIAAAVINAVSLPRTAEVSDLTIRAMQRS